MNAVSMPKRYRKSAKKELLVELLKTDKGLSAKEISEKYHISIPHISKVRAWILKGDPTAALERHKAPADSSKAAMVRCLGPLHDKPFYFLSRDKRKNRLCDKCRIYANVVGDEGEYAMPKVK